MKPRYRVGDVVPDGSGNNCIIFGKIMTGSGLVALVARVDRLQCRFGWTLKGGLPHAPIDRLRFDLVAECWAERAMDNYAYQVRARRTRVKKLWTGWAHEFSRRADKFRALATKINPGHVPAAAAFMARPQSSPPATAGADLVAR